MAEISKPAESSISASKVEQVRFRPLKESKPNQQFNLEDNLTPEQLNQGDIDVLKKQKSEGQLLAGAIKTKDGREAVIFDAKPGESVIYGEHPDYGPIMISGDAAVEISSRLFRRERPQMPERKPTVAGETFDQIVENAKKVNPNFNSVIPVLNESTFSMWQSALKEARNPVKIGEYFAKRAHAAIIGTEAAQEIVSVLEPEPEQVVSKAALPQVDAITRLEAIRDQFQNKVAEAQAANTQQAEVASQPDTSGEKKGPEVGLARFFERMVLALSKYEKELRNPELYKNRIPVVTALLASSGHTNADIAYGISRATAFMRKKLWPLAAQGQKFTEVFNK